MSEQPGRYQRSPSGMVGALIVTVLVILAFVAFRSCNRADLNVQPDHVDYLAQVGYAQRAGAELVYPSSLPSGWFATNLDLSVGSKPELTLSLLTGSGSDAAYVGFLQSPVPVAELLTTYVDPAPTSGPPVTLSEGVVRHWQTWNDSGGDTALVARRHGSSLMVFGGAPLDQLEELAASLTTRSLPS
jgi:hypothetical protein